MTARMRIKPCPKCNGHLILQADQYGAYLQCLRCGKHIEITRGNNEPWIPNPELNPDPVIPRQEPNGCDMSDSCLECPLPRCKHEDPLGYRKTKLQERDHAYIEVINPDNLSTKEAAEKLGINRRMVLRVRAKNRAGTTSTR